MKKIDWDNVTWEEAITNTFFIMLGILLFVMCIQLITLQ